MSDFSPEQVAAINELNARRAQLSPDQVAALDELSSRAAAPAGGGEKTVGGFLSNAVTSTAKVAGDIGTAIAHPSETAKAIGGVVMGGAQTAGRALGDKPVGVDYTPAFDRFVGRMKARYGGWQNIKDTAYSDPAGTALDASVLLDGVGGGLRAAGLDTAGKALKTAAEVIDPIRQGARAIGAVAKPVARVAANVLGKTTGVGTEAIDTAAKASDTFKQAMRGEISQEDVLKHAQDAISEVADQRRAAYQEKLGQLPADVTLPLDGIQTAANRLLKRFKVDVLKKADGSIDLDFGRSSIIDPAQQAKVKAAVDDLSTWGSKPGDTTPLGIDLLKQRLGEYAIGAGAKSDVIVNGAKSAARDLLEASVPGYKKLTQTYAESSDFLNTVRKELSSGNPGAAVRKLTTALNQNNSFRQTLIDALDQASGGDLKGAIAGTSMHELAPRGGVARLMAGGELVAALAHPGFALKFAGGLVAASPRIVGEMLVALAKARKAKAAVAAAVPVHAATVAAPIVAAQQSAADQAYHNQQ